MKCTNCTQPALRGKTLCLACFLSAENKKEEKRKVSHEEDDIQKAFFASARQLFPKLDKLLFAVPNGGRRDRREGGRLKAQGVTPGVADIICLVPRNGYNCLCLEAKTSSGRQSDSQKDFQRQIEAAGGKYELFRSVSEGIEILQEYLK